MSSFEQALLRLKEQAGTPTDKEVAELLGLQEKAFNARKRRDAFPEDKLRALVQQRPELGIDVNYVLTGMSAAAISQKLAGLPQRLRAVRGKRQIGEFAQVLDVSADEWEQIETGQKPISNGLVMLLVERVPELDVMWLLSGERSQLEGELSPLEVILVSNYRASSAEGQEMLRRFAASAAEYNSK